MDEVVDDEDDSSTQGISPKAFAPGYFNRFFVEERVLGSGGKGVVLLVRHQIGEHSIGQFACKRIPVGNDRVWLQKTIREAQLLQQLSHSHLVRYDWSWLEEYQISRFGPPVPCIFIIQEYCDGGDLFDYVRKPPPRMGSFSPGFGETFDENMENGPLSNQQLSPALSLHSSHGSIDDSSSSHPPHARALHFTEISSFFKDIASGLNHLHRAGYIHRDLKPHNCLLKLPKNPGDRLKVVLSDFGEMQPRDSIRTSTGYTATVSYSAPEVLQQDPNGQYGNFTPKSDVFSLGMILYFMCFSDLPYHAVDISNEENEDLDELKQEIARWTGFDIDTDTRPDLPEKLYTFLRQLLSLNPDDRPTADAVLQAVKSEVHFGPSTMPVRSSSRPTSPTSPSRPSSSSRVNPIESPPVPRRGSTILTRRPSEAFIRNHRSSTTTSRSMTLSMSPDGNTNDHTPSPPDTPRLSKSVPLLANAPFNGSPPSQRRRNTRAGTGTSPEPDHYHNTNHAIDDDDNDNAPNAIGLTGSDTQFLVEAPPLSALDRIRSEITTTFRDRRTLAGLRLALFVAKAMHVMLSCSPYIPNAFSALGLLAVGSLDLQGFRDEQGRSGWGRMSVTASLVVLHLALVWGLREAAGMCPSRYDVWRESEMEG